MLFGLINTPARFQDYINKILAKKLNIFIIVYLDDIFIYIENKGKKHIKPLWWIFDQLWKHLLYDKFKKCQFHQDEVRFLSYIVFHQNIRVKKEQIKAIYD